MTLNLLEQANIAAKQQKWSLLNQYLCQMVEPENWAELKAGKFWQQVLNLAVQILENGDFQERWEVAKLFPSLGTIAIAPLIAILKDEEAAEDVRWFVARILGEFDRPEVITAIVEILQNSESEEISTIASEALTNLGRSAIAALTKLLAKEETRLLAVRSLWAIRRQDIIPPLLTVISDPQPLIRATAIEALASFHDPRIPPVLLHALKDIAAPVRREAVIGLGLRRDLQAELDLVEKIIPLLWDFNIDVCAAAADALARLGTDAAADALFQVLRSPATPVSLQLKCVRSLCWIETAKALGYLQAALTLESTAIYQEIVTVLGRVETANLAPIAAEILIEALQSGHPAIQNPSIRQAIAISLGQLNLPQAVDSLIYLLEDVDLGVRLHAIAALKKFPSAFGQLQQLAFRENLTPEFRQGVGLALQEL